MKRRDFLKVMLVGTSTLAMPSLLSAKGVSATKPNVILCMADDMGWGDTGYNGHPVLKTHNLDRMAGEGIRFDRFYSGAPVCSPTRGSCITGRHPYRYGIYYANKGHMKKEEVTLAEVLKTQGYTTGHFGKWHLGTITRTVKDANRGGPRGAAHYSPPWENGFDECFSTESKVPTWDPMLKPAGQKNKKWWNSIESSAATEPYNTHYWTGPEQMAQDNLSGDDSRIIMDRAITFIEKAAGASQPFFTVIWFHAPHWPVVTGPKYRDMYPGQCEFAQNHFGCITAMDEQIGRLQKKLRKLGIANDTMLWFCSDNGPEGGVQGPKGGMGSAGPLRGRKRSLYEGGVRVPGLLVWPEKIKKQVVAKIPCSTSDYFSTVLDVLGYKLPEAQTRPYDGISLLELIDGRATDRSRPIGFESSKQVSLTDNRYKIYSRDSGKTFELYDLIEDQGETKDIAGDKPKVLEAMKKTLEAWRASCKASDAGLDYK
ncbi:MAG: sulfatase family protein [Planctomycetota bacterium]